MESHLKREPPKFEILRYRNPLSSDLPSVLVGQVQVDNTTKIWSSGKGLDFSSRVLSLTGELSERLAIYQTTADLISKIEPDAPFLNPDLFGADSPRRTATIEWLKVISNRRKTSASYFIHRPIRKSSAPRLYTHNSNGCAVGITLLDAKARARNEILERHNFLQWWYFNTLEIKELDFRLKKESILKRKGWEAFKYHIPNMDNFGTAVVLLINKSDKRFNAGAGIVGLCYGAKRESFNSALAECCQTLELQLLGGKVDDCLRFYLCRNRGWDLKREFSKRSTQLKHIKLGQEYFYWRKTKGNFRFYVEYFIEKAIPHKLGLTPSLKHLMRLKIKIFRRIGPVPIG